MGFFKKIKDAMMGAFDDEGLMNSLCEHLREIGVNATLLEPGSPDAIGPKWKREPFASGFVVGCIHVEGHTFDMIQVERRMAGGASHDDDTPDEPSTIVYAYHYVVRGDVEGLEKQLKANVKLITKGFIRREVINFQWVGGDLAQLLNADADLSKLLLREGLSQVPSVEIQLDRTNRCIRMTQQFQIPMGRGGRFSVGIGGFSVGMGERPRDFDDVMVEITFPSSETIETFDLIAHHIRNFMN